MTALLLIGGLIALAIGGEALVRGASVLAAVWGITPLLIGSELIHRNIPVMIAVSALVWLLALRSQLSRWMGSGSGWASACWSSSGSCGCAGADPLQSPASMST
jgi:Ca2+/Na+ antiporter